MSSPCRRSNQSAIIWLQALVSILLFRIGDGFLAAPNVFAGRCHFHQELGFFVDRHYRSPWLPLYSSSSIYLERPTTPRHNVTLPLLDLFGSDFADQVVTPLPSAHLPDELRSLHVYGVELTRPVHRMLMEEAIGTVDDVTMSSDEEKEDFLEDYERLYGHLVWKPSSGDTDDVFSSPSLVGAIGCAANILIKAPTVGGTSVQPSSEQKPISSSEETPFLLVSQGSFRFIVREIVKTFPYPVAVVDELVDNEPGTIATSSVVPGDDKDDDLYTKMDPSDLIQRIFMGLDALVDQKLKVPPMSPLEVSILKETVDPDFDPAIQQSQGEEMAAVLDVFKASLVDIFSSAKDRYYAIAMMAAEMANVDNKVRAQLLSMRDGVERLRLVLREMERNIGMAQARLVANEIMEKSDESSKDLKVGKPQLPPWSRKIKKGLRVSYYWNEDFGWCDGEVIEDPVRVVDELVLTVRFDDGEVHRLPFQGDEKARWRPIQ